MPNTYSEGTISVTNGSKEAVLDRGLAIPSTMKAGDRIVVNGLSNFENSVASVDPVDPSKLLFAVEWAGPTGAEFPYVVTHMPIGWGDRVELAEGVAEDIRLLKTGVLTAVNVALREELFADLAYPADTLGKVYDDPTEGYSGVYKKLGQPGEGSWVRIGPLPERLEINTYMLSTTAAIARNAAMIIELNNRTLE